MLAGIRSRLTFANVVSVTALFAAVGLGTAWALEANSVKSKHIAPNAAKGVDVDEPTLEGVDAASVGGLQVRKINFDVPYDDVGPYQPVLSLGGLEITAACRTFGDVLDVKATTTKDDALFSISAVSAAGLDTTKGTTFPDWDSNDSPADIDNWFPHNGTAGIGTVHYQVPDGSLVVANFSLNDYGGVGVGCDMVGVAFGA